RGEEVKRGKGEGFRSSALTTPLGFGHWSLGRNFMGSHEISPSRLEGQHGIEFRTGIREDPVIVMVIAIRMRAMQRQTSNIKLQTLLL
ncbi:hypothetical protein KAJ77_10925, partial [bacterium]|nr:hypothetical protein [bacterium]